jgi:hypothetical protein
MESGSQPQSASPPPLALPLRLSQGLLNLLSTCPRKFQHLYIEQLGSYTLPDQQARMTEGSHFHALLQQWQMGLPVATLASSDRQLEQWFTAFVQAAPEILGTDAAAVQCSEQSRTMAFEDYLLTVVYDFVILTPQSGQILDWKTYARPEQPQRLRQNWQTRLYPFVLVETSRYEPEAVNLVYWFFQSPGSAAAGAVQQLRIAHDRRLHEQTRRDLSQLLRQLSRWLALYQQGEPFPQVNVDSPECGHCSFAVRCDRAHGGVVPNADPVAYESWNTVPPLTPVVNLASIPEIPL